MVEAGSNPAIPERIKVSASCLADIVTAGLNASLAAIIRPYKHNRKGEGFARSVFYRPACLAIRHYHDKRNSPDILDAAIFELQKRHDLSTKTWEKTRCARNIQAIDAYRRRYKDRKFLVQTNHRLSFKIGRVTVTAEPDLWVTENGIPVLLKIGLAKKSRSFIDVLLTVIRKAAIASGHKVRAKNIVYLDISNGTELICSRSLTGFNQTFRSLANRIVREWPKIESQDSSSRNSEGTDEAPGAMV